MSPVAVENRQAGLPMAVLLRTKASAAKRQYARGDRLPEQTGYRDDGCDIHPACLTCPLPRCRYDEKGGLRAMINAYRDQQIGRLRDSGVSSEELSASFGLSKRTIFRILEMQHVEAVASRSMEARCA